MAKSSFIFNFKKDFKNKIPKASILFIIFFILTEFILFLFGPYIAINPINAIFRAQIEISKSKNFKKDILIFGDSSAQLALNSNKIQEVTGLTCYNFATIGNATLAGNYFLFEHYLKSNEAPRSLIMMNVYDIWHRDLRSEGTMDVLASYFFKDTINNLLFSNVVANKNKFLIFKAIAGQTLPSLRYKYELKRIAEMTISSKKSFFKNIKNTINRNRRMKTNLILRGGNYREYVISLPQVKSINDNLEIRKKNINEDISNHLEFVQKNEFFVSNLNRYYLNKFIGETKERKTKILLCYPPILNEFYNNERASTYLISVKNFIRELAESHKNVFLLTEEFYIVTADELFDAIDHLTEKESLIFSELIGKKILKYVDN